MKIQKKIFFKKIRKLYFLAVLFLVFGIYGASFVVTKAMPSPEEIEAIENMSEEEKQAFMEERRQNGEGGPMGGNPGQGKESFGQREKTEGVIQTEEEKIERINKAKSALERNRMRLRVARNIATSTVSQLKLEGTDVDELLVNLGDFEKRMDEIEGLYKDHIDQLLLFERDRADDPGSLDEVFKQAGEKRAELLAFYKETFRGNLESALIKNKEEKGIR